MKKFIHASYKVSRSKSALAESRKLCLWMDKNVHLEGLAYNCFWEGIATDGHNNYIKLAFKRLGPSGDSMEFYQDVRSIKKLVVNALDNSEVGDYVHEVKVYPSGDRGVNWVTAIVLFYEDVMDLVES